MKLRFHRTLLYFIIIIQLTSLYCYGTTDTFAPANKILDAESVITQSTASSGADSGRWPNDFYSSVFNDNENANIALPTAWLLQTASSVKVGITDTGIYANHEDFAGNYMGGASFISNEPNYGVDPNGHGTKIAGIFGAVGNNEIGVNGVCWYSHIKSLKVLDNTGNGDPYDLIAAIEYADQYGIKILNASLGWYIDLSDDETREYNEELIENMTAAITDYDGIIICSAGNEAISTDTNIHIPSSLSCSNIIAVGALDSSLADMYFESNYGATSVDVFAPGDSIYTTSNSGGYVTGSATSAAAPFVTGLAALIWEAAPSLSVAKVKAAILNNTDAVEKLSGKCVTGGKINAFKALRSVLDTKSSPRTLVGDINGDGIEDQVISGRLNGYLRLSVFLGKSDGTFEQARHTFSVKVYAQSDPLFIGDVNGDGYDDVVLHWVSSAKRQLMTFFGNQYGYLELNSDQKGYNSAINLTYDMTNHPSQSFLKDVTGDGKADFICHMKDDNGCRGFWVYKGKSGTGGFNTTPVISYSANNYVSGDPVFMEDVSGDGVPDFVVHWANNNARQLLTYTSSGSGTFNAPVNLATSNTHNPSVYPSKLMLGDATGDGKADFVVMWKNGDGKRCILQYKGTVNSAGKATFNTGSHLLTSTRGYYDSDPVYLEDVTGDGKKDVIVYWKNSGKRQMLVYKSIGTDFNEGLNCATSNRDNDKYLSDHRFGDVSTATGGKDMLFRWGEVEQHITNFQTYTCNSSGQFNSTVIRTPTYYFPYYVYR